MPSLIDLPPEISIEIVSHLSLSDLVACQLTHSSLHHIIFDSPQVQYYLAARIAGVEDNKNSELSVYERLEKLKVLEERWNTAHWHFDFSHSVETDHGELFGLARVHSGVLWLTSKQWKALRWSKLPALADTELQWKTIDFATNIVVLGFGIDEHDLVAVAIRSVLPFPRGK